jgi:DNA-directed RNA polymerase beta subunit
MGSNMQRQAVPLLIPEAPIVGQVLNILQLEIQEQLLLLKLMVLLNMSMLKE